MATSPTDYCGCDDFGIYGRADESENPPNESDLAEAIAKIATATGVTPTPSDTPGFYRIPASEVAKFAGLLEWPAKSGRYPWPVWERGRRWTVRRGLHFTPSLLTFRNMLYHRAMLRGLRCHVELINEDTLAFQFRPAAS